ncbi:MAG: Rubredoxin, partial [uncultured Solirubrobacteraceae bacterium]
CQSRQPPRSGSARRVGSSMTPRKATRTAASRPEPPSNPFRTTGSARSAAPARKTSLPTRT